MGYLLRVGFRGQLHGPARLGGYGELRRRVRRLAQRAPTVGDDLGWVDVIAAGVGMVAEQYAASDLGDECSAEGNAGRQLWPTAYAGPDLGKRCCHPCADPLLVDDR